MNAVTIAHSIPVAMARRRARPNREDIDAALSLSNAVLKNFMPESERFALACGLRGEEGWHFVDQIIQTTILIQDMPKTYDQDGKGMEAIAYLHYFRGGMDWYITEKDMGDPADPDDTRQHQAFGMADIGYGPSLGYISIQELIENGVELDLHFTPTPLKELRHD